MVCRNVCLDETWVATCLDIFPGWLSTLGTYYVRGLDFTCKNVLIFIFVNFFKFRNSTKIAPFIFFKISPEIFKLHLGPQCAEGIRSTTSGTGVADHAGIPASAGIL